LFQTYRKDMPLQYVVTLLAVALDEGKTVMEYARMQGISPSVMSRHLLDILAPERCAACETVVAADDLFCHACREAVNAIGARPPIAMPGGGNARAVAEYDADRRPRPVADALHAFKYRGAWRLAPRLAAAMAGCAGGREEADGPEERGAPPLVVPVPVVLHDALARMRKGRGSGALVDLGTGDVPAPLLGGRRSW